MKKEKILVGVIAYRDPKTKEVTATKNIYKDWTPELQKYQDKMNQDLAAFYGNIIKRNLIEYEKTNGAMTNLTAQKFIGT